MLFSEAKQKLGEWYAEKAVYITPKLITCCHKAVDILTMRKPIESRVENIDFYDYSCPRCNNFIIAKVDGKWIAGKKQKHCDECGQALDWTDL